MRLLSDSIGRKAIMAVTGLLMVLFLIGHLLGNSTIFAGADYLNSYAEKLHAMPALVWGTRVVMLVAVLLHLVLSIQLTMENSEANPTKYAVDRHLKATFASKSMIWTGLLLGCFVVFHLLHFTTRSIPGVVQATDALNRFDVYRMVTDAFHGFGLSILYVIAMIVLFLHLSHGVQSTFQSLGLSNDKVQPRFGLFGRVLSAIFLVVYGAIPVAILIRVIGS